MRKIFIIIFSLLMIASHLLGAGRKVLVDSVHIEDSHLALDFSIEGIIDDKIAEGLQKGRTLTLEYNIQLWEKSSGLISHLKAERLIRMKVNFDFWENKFVIYRPEEKRLTSSIETVRERCSEIHDFNVISLDKLKSDSDYYINIELALKPLSVENYEEIKNWLSGEVKDISLKKMSNPEEQEKGFKNRILRVFMAITGFGDRVISGKTENFKIHDNEIVWH
ncbi:DUF4390 domain-containing protein [candidate division KSB1 bacterium]|nr:DUF4390 domain-containing protein [candidate division KSB1 bacterium]